MHGIVPSLNTPFNAAGELDLYSLSNLVDHSVIAGCGGMLGLAVAGEQNRLTLKEKINFIDLVVNKNDGRIPFICSVTSSSFADSIKLTKVARSAGADGICIQLPSNLDRFGKERFLEKIDKESPDILMIQDLDWTGGGLSLDEITSFFDQFEKFNWLKIETPQAGIKYSAVLDATAKKLNVCGGWAVTQLLDALARCVNAFIPTGIEVVYVKIYDAYNNDDKEKARLLFEEILPVLNFSNQNIATSIRFFKNLRVLEGLFESNYCREASAVFDAIQAREAEFATTRALKLISEYS